MLCQEGGEPAKPLLASVSSLGKEGDKQKTLIFSWQLGK